MKNEVIKSEAFQRQKKLFTFLPVIVIPCMTLLFWALGGGSGAQGAESSPGAASRINTRVPPAMLEIEKDKMEAYADAERKSREREYLLRGDPYAESLGGSAVVVDVQEKWAARLQESQAGFSERIEVFSEQLERAEQSHNTAFTQPARPQHPSSRGGGSPIRPLQMPQGDAEEDLQAMMRELDGYASGNSSIPPTASEDSLASAQLETLDRIMERAMYLQHPDLVESEIRRRSEAEKGEVLVVSKRDRSNLEVAHFGRPGGDTLPPGNGFYDDSLLDGFEQITVRAQVHNTITVTDGSTVKLRLLDDVYVAGQRIPANAFVHGVVSFRGDRVALDVSSINHRGNIYDVELTAYDVDGQEGLAVPGSIERQIAKREAARGITSFRPDFLTDDLAAQMATQGLEAVKEIARAKVRLIKVELKSGHHIILRNR